MSALLAPPSAVPTLNVVEVEPLDQARLLRKLASQRSALIPVDVLPGLWKLSAESCADTVVTLMASGALEAWATASGPGVILSSATARSFGLELVSPESDRRARLTTKAGTPTP